MIDLFDPTNPPVPPAGTYIVRLFKHDTVDSKTAGQMRRLIGEIVRGPFAGQLVYKPLTNDMRGIGWAEEAVARVGRPVPHRTYSKQLVACLDALTLASVECEAKIYLYRHPTEGVFPTIGTVKSLEKRR